MLKPSGMLKYFVNALAGGGGAVTKNIIADDDNNGNHIDVAKLPSTAAADIDGLLEAFFVPTAVALNGTAGLCFVVTGVTVVNGVVTAVEAALTNSSPAAGDTVSGFLYVRLNHGENLAI